MVDEDEAGEVQWEAVDSEEAGGRSHGSQEKGCGCIAGPKYPSIDQCPMFNF